MTKKDYILIGNVFLANRNMLEESKAYHSFIHVPGIVQAIERDMAEMLQRDNPRFDVEKFYAYIGH